jgi:hypothetical protein
MKQNRITLKKLKVAEFASEETLCFAADVYFDGKLIAEAKNDGCGGMTFVQPTDHARFNAACAFVATLPEEVSTIEDKTSSNGFFTYKMKIDDLVDHIASKMQDEKRIRAAFNRAMKKIAFVVDVKGKPVLYTTATKLPDNPNMRETVLNMFMTKNPKAVVLNRLSAPEAFELFQQVAVQ